jgi:hypothetical protein
MRKPMVERLADVRPNNKHEHQVRDEISAGKAPLLNFGNNNRVMIQWGMNSQTVEDQIFILTIDGREAWIAKEDLLRFLRWV